MIVLLDQIMGTTRTMVIHHIYNTLFTNDPINIFLLNLTDPTVFAFSGVQSYFGDSEERDQ